jgi:endonuclease/exonuclease/phosphatase family metal-dependent hydrolase
VASINLHCGRDRRGVPFPVSDALGALDTDLVLVQESWRPAGSDSLIRKVAAEWGYGEPLELDFLPETTLRALDVVGRDGADESGGWGLAVLSRLPWRRTEQIWLGSARGDVGPRGALVVEVELPGGAVLRVVDVHLTHRVVHGPAQLRRLVRALGDPARPTIIGGDLNMCRPTVGLARPYRPVPRGRTWPAGLPVAQIDHLLRGPGVTVTDRRVGPAVGSDHLPVRMSLRIP